LSSCAARPTTSCNGASCSSAALSANTCNVEVDFCGYVRGYYYYITVSTTVADATYTLLLQDMAVDAPTLSSTSQVFNSYQAQYASSIFKFRADSSDLTYLYATRTDGVSASNNYPSGVIYFPGDDDLFERERICGGSNQKFCC